MYQPGRGKPRNYHWLDKVKHYYREPIFRHKNLEKVHIRVVQLPGAEGGPTINDGDGRWNSIRGSKKKTTTWERYKALVKDCLGKGYGVWVTQKNVFVPNAIDRGGIKERVPKARYRNSYGGGGKGELWWKKHRMGGADVLKETVVGRNMNKEEGDKL